MKNKITTRGPYGEKMIKLTTRFFTSDMPKGTNLKTGWVSGVIHLEKNNFRGIEHKQEFFHKLDEVLPAMQKLLDKEGITLVERPTGKLVEKKFK